MNTDNLYLILHKVRGQPAFDVARRCEEMGTESDPGPWWILPTGGQRARPYRVWDLRLLRTDVSDSYPASFATLSLPIDLPDLYHCNDLHKVEVKINLADLIGALGEPFTRRAL